MLLNANAHIKLKVQTARISLELRKELSKTRRNAVK